MLGPDLGIARVCHFKQESISDSAVMNTIQMLKGATQELVRLCRLLLTTALLLWSCTDTGARNLPAPVNQTIPAIRPSAIHSNAPSSVEVSWLSFSALLCMLKNPDLCLHLCHASRVAPKGQCLLSICHLPPIPPF